MVPAATAQTTTLINYFVGKIVFNAKPAEADFTDNYHVHRSRRGEQHSINLQGEGWISPVALSVLL